jgi:hypothetical protein
MNDKKNDIIKIYNFSASTIFTIIGIIGNTIVIYILTKPNFRKESTFRFLIISTIGSSIKLSATWPSSFYQSAILDDLNCKILSYMGFLIGRFPPWINGLGSIDRYISVKYPQKFKFRNQFKYQALAVLIVFIALIFLDLPFYFYVGKQLNRTSCEEINPEAGIFLNIYYLILTILIPVTISLVTAYLTSKQLIKHKKKLHIVNFKKEKQHFYVLLGINILFTFSQIPYILFLSICVIMKMEFFGTLVYYIVYSLTNVYVSFDIIIYFISNKLFRKQCLYLIGFYFKKKKTSEIIELTEIRDVKLTHYKKFYFF